MIKYSLKKILHNGGLLNKYNSISNHYNLSPNNGDVTSGHYIYNGHSTTFSSIYNLCKQTYIANACCDRSDSSCLNKSNLIKFGESLCARPRAYIFRRFSRRLNVRARHGDKVILRKSSYAGTKQRYAGISDSRITQHDELAGPSSGTGR